MALLGKYCDKWKLKINYTKAVYSVFIMIPKVQKQKQTINIQGHQVKKEENPIYLGITYLLFEFPTTQVSFRTILDVC